MEPENNLENTAGHKRRPRRIVLGLGTLVLVVVAVFLLSVGSWLVVEDPLEKAQAIVVLSGGMPLRAREAARLYRQGYAPRVWLTHSTEPGATLEQMQIVYLGEDFYDRQVLMHDGVPAEAIRLLDLPIVNTADEIAVASSELAKEKGSTVIIVTSKVHTRRTRILWQRLVANRAKGIIRAASDDPFEPRRWWHTTGDALAVVREVLGILNAWAGMPLHPAN